MGDALGSKKREKAAKTQKLQEQQIEKQAQLERARLSEEKAEIERKKAGTRAGQAGRSLLVQTSQTGTPKASLGA